MKNRDYYRLLINKDPIELKANSKWERDLQIDQTSMKALFSCVKSVCKDNKLREFYFKLLHRIVVTKKESFLFGKAETPSVRIVLHGKLSINEFVVNLKA